MKIQVVVSWFLTPYSDVVGYQRYRGSCWPPSTFHLEDGGSTVLRNFGILPHYSTTLQSRRPRLQASVLHSIVLFQEHIQNFISESILQNHLTEGTWKNCHFFYPYSFSVLSFTYQPTTNSCIAYAVE